LCLLCLISSMPNHNSVPSLTRSLIAGGLGFSLVALCVFATVATGEVWLYRKLTVYGAYLFWTALFILLGGLALGSLVVGRWRLPKFYLLFGLAFFAYAFGWTALYFALRGFHGQWLGLLAGSILMAIVFAAGFRVMRSILKFAALLFVANWIGYFWGADLNDRFGGTAGMMLWGVVYGLFLGAAIGAVLHYAQVQQWKPENS